MATDVFISYRRTVHENNQGDGKDKSRILALELKDKGYKVFLDYQDINDGDYHEAIEHAIKDCKVFLLLLTEGALDRCEYDDDEVAREIRKANEYECHFIPVTFDTSDFPKPGNLPNDLDFIFSTQFHKILSDEYHESSINELCKKIGKPNTQNNTPSTEEDKKVGINEVVCSKCGKTVKLVGGKEMVIGGAAAIPLGPIAPFALGLKKIYDKYSGDYVCPECKGEK